MGLQRGDTVQIRHVSHKGADVGVFVGKIIQVLGRDSYSIRWKVEEGDHKGEYTRVFSLDDLTLEEEEEVG